VRLACAAWPCGYRNASVESGSKRQLERSRLRLPGAEAIRAPGLSTWVERFVAEVEGRHPGLRVDLARNPSASVVLSHIVVPPDLCGRGIGDQVMAQLLQLADEYEGPELRTASPAAK
jgi:hypothetical protein